MSVLAPAAAPKAALAPAAGTHFCDRLAYAIGDVHGRGDLLPAMIDAIAADSAARRRGTGERPLLVFLGDYIDRGPASREVIDQMLALERDGRFEARFLMGNHEEAMLDYLDGRTSGAGWARFGGAETIRSYGLEPPADSSRAAWSDFRPRLAAAVPEEHLDFLRRLELMVAAGRLLFVHAGIRPGVPVERQERRDLLWIRSEFLHAPRADRWLVVHGHTPKDSAYGAPGRLCLDSGAYLSGRLTAALFDGDAVALIESPHHRPRPLEVRFARD